MAAQTCLLVSGIFPPEVGGPARFVPDVAEGLVARGWRCGVVTLGHPMQSDARFDFEVTRVPRRPLPIRIAATVRAIATHAAVADVVLSNGLLIESAMASGLARKPLVVKVVGDDVWERATRRGWTGDDLEHFQARGDGARVRCARAARRHALEQASRIVAPSQYTASLVRRWLPSRPTIDVIPNAVREGNGRAVDLPPHVRALRKIAMVGRLVPLKRVGAVIEVLRSLPDAALIVIGDGPARAALEERSRHLGTESRTVFTGRVPAETIVPTLRGCDLLVVNSTTENCPHAILDAFAARLPIVATRVGGVPEMIRHGTSGLLVPLDDSCGLTSAIRLVLDDASLAARLRAGAAAAGARFSWPSMIDRIERVLREAAGHSSAC